MEVVSYEALDNVLNKISKYYNTEEENCSVPTEYLNELFNLNTLVTDEEIKAYWRLAIQGETYKNIYICSNCGEWSDTKECTCPNCNAHMY